jgi:hypothetical protein
MYIHGSPGYLADPFTSLQRLEQRHQLEPTFRRQSFRDLRWRFRGPLHNDSAHTTLHQLHGRPIVQFNIHHLGSAPGFHSALPSIRPSDYPHGPFVGPTQHFSLFCVTSYPDNAFANNQGNSHHHYRQIANMVTLMRAFSSSNIFSHDPGPTRRSRQKSIRFNDS